MEIQASAEYNNGEGDQETVRVVTVEEFSQLLQSQPRKRGSGSRKRLIHGVPPHLRARQTNKHVYDPELISLGPYHHGKPELREAEEFKYFCLDWLANGDENIKVHFYNKVLEKVDVLRACYAEATIVEKYDDTKLALMMLLDACFIINLMENCTGMRTNNNSDWLDSHGMAASIQIMIRDVFVLENQIPFQVIDLLVISSCGNMTELVKSFLGWTMKGDLFRANDTGEAVEPPIHILEACLRAVTESNLLRRPEPMWWPRILMFLSPFHWLGSLLNRAIQERLEIHASHTSCRSVMDLKAKGIHFAPSQSRSLLDITFDSHAVYGKLKLPVQYVCPQTQVMLSNLIAYEVSPNSKVMPITLAYVVFMKSLIETPDDVKELQRKGILINSFPNHEQAVKVFSEIDTFGYGDLDILAEVKHRVEAHCINRWKTWVADLIHTRFQSPWTAIALLAAAFLLSLTFVQAYYTMNPVRKL